MQYTGNVGWWYYNRKSRAAIGLTTKITAVSPMLRPFGFHSLRFKIFTEFGSGHKDKNRVEDRLANQTKTDLLDVKMV